MGKIIKSDDEGVIILLSEKEQNEISASRKDIENESFIENKLLNKEVKIWLKER